MGHAEGTETDPSPAPDGLTVRSLAAGLGVGVLLTITNVYMGLKTGWWDTGHVTASALGAALLVALDRRRPLSPGEGATLVAAATAAGAAPATLGLMGAIPALAQLGRPPPYTAIAALGLALAVLGILGALALRRRWLEEERLPFPTGTAAAEVVHALRGGGDRRPARALGAAALAGGAFTAARELGAVPALLAPPVTLLGTPAAALGLGLGAYPMLAGAGMLIGLRNGLSIGLGAVIAWGLIAPWLVASGAVASAEYAPLQGWLAWPGVGLALGAGLVSIAGQWRAFAGAARDVRGLGAWAGVRGPALLAAGAAGVAIAAASLGMGVPPLRAAAALLVAGLLALVAARATGQTDILPAGEVAQIAQLGLGAAGGAPVNVAAAGLTAGLAVPLSVSLQSLRAASALRAPSRPLLVPLLAGAALGTGVALPLYAGLAAAHGLGSAALPVPSAVPMRAVAELVARGTSALPPSTLGVTAAAFAAGVGLELLGGRVRWLPSASALGMGFIAPAQFAGTLLAGSAAGALWRRRSPGSAPALLSSTGAGLIAGESLAAAVALALAALGL